MGGVGDRDGCWKLDTFGNAAKGLGLELVARQRALFLVIALLHAIILVADERRVDMYDDAAGGSCRTLPHDTDVVS